MISKGELRQENFELSEEINAVSRAMRPCGLRFMDPPDGGSVSTAQQVERLVAEWSSLRAQLASVQAERDALREAVERAADEILAFSDGGRLLSLMIATNPHEHPADALTRRSKENRDNA